MVRGACSLEKLVIHTVGRRKTHTLGHREAHTAGHQEEEEARTACYQGKEADIDGRRVAHTVGHDEDPPSVTSLRSRARARPRPRRAAGCSPKTGWACEERLACPFWRWAQAGGMVPSTRDVNEPANEYASRDILRRDCLVAFCYGFDPASRATCSPGNFSRMTHASDGVLSKGMRRNGSRAGTASIRFQIFWENTGTGSLKRGSGELASSRPGVHEGVGRATVWTPAGAQVLAIPGGKDGME